MASTVNSSTQTTWSWMIWLCAYSAGIGPVTPTTWSAGWFEVPARVFVRARGLLAERRAGLEVQERDDRGGVLRRAYQQARGVRQRERSGQARDAAGRARAERSGQAGGAQVLGLGQRLRHPGRRGGLGELTQRAGDLPVGGQRLADRPDLRRRRQALRVPLHDGHGGVEREAEQLAGVGLRVRRRRSRRDELGQPAGGGVQRRQEHDGGRDGGGPPGDDQEPQADHHGGVAPGQQAHRRLRLATGCWLAGCRSVIYGGMLARRHEDRHYPGSGSLLLPSPALLNRQKSPIARSDARRSARTDRVRDRNGSGGTRRKPARVLLAGGALLSLACSGCGMGSGSPPPHPATSAATAGSDPARTSSNVRAGRLGARPPAPLRSSPG